MIVKKGHLSKMIYIAFNQSKESTIIMILLGHLRGCASIFII